MKLKKLLSFSLLLLFALPFKIVFSQIINSSNTFVQTYYNKSMVSSINNASYIFYEENKGLVFLKLDFKKFLEEGDSLNDWLFDLAESHLYFKAELPPETFYSLSNRNSKSITLNGQIFFNGHWHNQRINLGILHTENSVLSQPSNNMNLDGYRLSFNFSIQPKDFRIQYKPHHLTKNITIGVSSGRINVLSPEMIPVLSEIYK
jgi:hypothetical protein